MSFNVKYNSGMVTSFEAFFKIKTRENLQKIKLCNYWFEFNAIFARLNSTFDCNLEQS